MDTSLEGFLLSQFKEEADEQGFYIKKRMHRLIAAVESTLEIHHPTTFPSGPPEADCAQCYEDYPCTTVQRIREALR